MLFQKLQVTWFRNTVVLNNSDKHDSLLGETIASLFQLLMISSQIFVKGKFSKNDKKTAFQKFVYFPHSLF